MQELKNEKRDNQKGITYEKAADTLVGYLFCRVLCA